MGITREERAMNRVNALLTAVAFVFLASTTPLVSGIVPDPWTSRSSRKDAGVRGSEKASIDNSHRRLEDQVSRETQDLFGEDFSRQLEEEREASQVVHNLKARVGREAGCHPTSPLSSALLGADAVDDDAVAGRGGQSAQNGAGGPMADWLQ